MCNCECLSWFSWKLLCWLVSRNVIKSVLKSQVLLLTFLALQFKDLARPCLENMEFSNVCHIKGRERKMREVGEGEKERERHMYSLQRLVCTGMSYCRTVYTYRETVIKGQSIANFL